ncbi:MAG: ABC transporter transmembrane domain-containing protein [Enterocloster sp.]|uniref:ABC transporter transmembrane domain-containing protein n=1 Tax=Enterocloster sp. TaxID=2719315 RepID=UPI00399A5A8D
MRLLQWAGPERKWLILSVLCAFGSGILVITSYIGIYRLMDAVLSGACTNSSYRRLRFAGHGGHRGKAGAAGYFGCAVSQGAYEALFRVRCMVTEHLCQSVSWSLGRAEHRRGSKPFSMRTSRSWNCFWPTTCRNLWPISRGPVVIFPVSALRQCPLATGLLIPLPLAGIVMAVIFRRMKGVLSDVNRSLVGFNSVMIEYISGMRLIKAYNMGSRSFQKFSHAVDEENRSGTWSHTRRLRPMPPFCCW